MSAPSYNSSSYDTAAAKYEQLAQKYAGENAYKNTLTASDFAKQQAQGYAESESAVARRNALNSGLSGAMAARAGANARANAYKNAYNDSYNSSLNNINTANQNALQAQGALLNGAMQKDSNKYQSDSNRYGAAMGAVGGLFTGASNALSDGTQKEIHAKTDCNKRREELLSRLKGGK